MSRVLFTYNTTKYLVRFRGRLIERLKDAGADVHALTPADEYVGALETLGVRWHPWRLSRHGTNPAAEARSLYQAYGVIRALRPAVLVNVTLKAVLYAGIAGALAGTPRRVALVAGLGNVLRGGGLPSRALHPFYRKALASHHGIMVQNTDDEQRMRELLGPRTALLKLPGSGVDLAQFSPPPAPPAGRPLVMMVTRLVWAKGLREFCAVASRLRDAADFALVGSLDSNPDSPTRAEIVALAAQHGVELKLDVEDVAAELRRAHAFAYPSYYPEGIPRSLIEALAVGVPVVTTLSPGCREAIEDGKEGFVVPPKDVEALERGLRKLLADPELRGALRLRARARAERVFDERAVASSMAEFLLPG